MAYSQQTLFYFHRLQHAGFDEGLLADGFFGEAGVMANGDKVQMVLGIADDQIHTVRYHVYGSVATMACAEFLASELEGNSVALFNEWTGERVLGALQLPSIKMNSAIIVTTAVERALRDYME